MTTKISRFQKTDHFLYRQWDRKIEDSVIDKALAKLNLNCKTKTHLIIGVKFLREMGVKASRKTNLIIVVKQNVLITLFPVSDLRSYLQSINSKNVIIIN
jgi:hypothetical protein